MGPTSLGARPTPPGRAGQACGPCKSVGALLRAARKLISEKNRVKISARSELRISGYLRNGVRPENQKRENRENREERSNLGGAPALREPWRPRTRGGTLLPSRGKAKQEEEGGGPLSPSLPVAPERRRGNHRDGDHLHQLRRFVNHLHHLLPLYNQWCTLSPRCNLLLEHGALCYILLSNDVLHLYYV